MVKYSSSESVRGAVNRVPVHLKDKIGRKWIEMRIWFQQRSENYRFLHGKKKHVWRKVCSFKACKHKKHIKPDWPVTGAVSHVWLYVVALTDRPGMDSKYSGSQYVEQRKRREERKESESDDWESDSVGERMAWSNWERNLVIVGLWSPYLYMISEQ